MRRVSYDIGAPSAKTWDEALANPAPVTVESLVTGTVAFPISRGINLKHPGAAHIPEKLVECPIMAHLVRHERLGDYLVDTGLDSTFAQNPYSRMSGLILKNGLSRGYTQSKGQDICACIKGKGANIKAVFLTHLHYDHIAGIPELPKGLRYITAKDEKPMDIPLLLRGDFLGGVDQLHEIDFNRCPAMPPFGPAADVLGDGSLWAMATPGHSKGHMSFLVNGKGGPVLLTGDACLLRVGLETGVGPGMFNMATSQKSMDMISGFVKAYPQVRVVCGHQLD